MTTHQGEASGDAGTVELRGKVKWFNAVKGYGFLALDIDNSDAFLHVTTLRQSGHEDLKPGATVVCAGVRGPKGWQVMKVLDVDSSTAVAVAPKPPPIPDGVGHPRGGHLHARDHHSGERSYCRNVRLNRPASSSSGGAVAGRIRDTP